MSDVVFFGAKFMNTQLKLHSAILLALSTQTAYALDPAAVDFEGIQVTPTLEIAGSYDDNYLTLNDPESSWITSITPNVKIMGFGEKSTFEASYMLNHQIYHEENADNLTNHFLSAKADFEFDVRNRLNLNAGYSRTQTASDAYTLGELNSFKSVNAGAKYIYGAPSATGNIEVGVNYDSIRSTNGENLDVERDSTGADIAFVYKATAKTRLTAEVAVQDFDYDSNDALDSQNTSYLLGARWEATARATGYAKIGKQDKDFDDSSIDNADLTNWEVSVEWAPKSYSVFTLGTNQRIDEGLYGANHVDARTNQLAWKHDWGRGYTSQMNYRNIDRDYSNGRDDEVNSYGLGVKYMAKRWMDIGLDYQSTRQDSSSKPYDYDRDVFKFSVNLSL